MARDPNVRRKLPVLIGGEPWSLLLLTRQDMPRNTWGDCNRRTKTIRVRCDLSPKNMLDTMIHEIRHAQHPIMFEAEEFIGNTSTEIAEILLATGCVSVRTCGKRAKQTKQKK